MNSATLELFESVRAVLNGRHLDEAAWRELAMRVGETSTAFRRRLDRAVRYARLGLRLEAASEAEAEPSLFEMAQLLDTEDYHKWRALCTRQHWPVPELPDAAALGEIEEAIGQLRPLRKLLAKMRVQVLSDAGPWERMQVLRELARRDEHNPVWRDDLDAIEPVCAQWLGERADAALREGHLHRAAECIANLEETEWRHAGVARHASDLRARLDSAVVAACAKDAEATLGVLEAEWAAQSEEGVQGSLHTWHGLEQRAARHGGTLPEALVARAAAVQSWASERRTADEDQRAHRSAAAALEDVLSRERVGLRDLRRALAASEATAEGCPDGLRRQALEAIDLLERRSAMRRTATAAAAVLVVVAMVAAIWWGVTHTAQSNRIEALATAIRGHVSAGSLDQAGHLLAEADQDLATSADARMIAARREYMAARAAIAEGDRDFDAAMAAAADPNGPEATAGDIERADGLARTGAQRTAVDEWKRLQRRAETARTAARVQDQLKEVRAIAESAAAIAPRADDPATIAALADLESRLGAVSRSAGGDARVLGEVQGAQALLAAHRGTLQGQAERTAREHALRSIISAAGDPMALRLAIEAFMREHSGTPEARALAEAAQAAPLWPSVTDWSAIAQAKPIAAAATAEQRDRDAMSADLRTYAASNPGSPFAAPARALVALLPSMPQWRDWLAEKMTDLPEFKYYSIELRDGARLYTLQDPGQAATQSEPGGGAYRIYSVIATGGVDPKSTFQRVDVAAIKSQGPSPQTVLAGQLRDLLEDSSGEAMFANDVQAALSMLARLRDAEAVDGVFAAHVARGLLESIEPEAPPVLRAPLQAAAKRIVREKLDQVDWAAGSASARERGRAMKALLRETLKVEAWRKAYADAIAAAAAPLLVRYEPAGVILGGRIEMPDMRRAAPGTELFALRIGVGNAPSTMVRVGKVEGDGTAAFDAAAEAWPAGTQVFARVGGGA